MDSAGDGLKVLRLAYPFRGRWLVRNSPANRVPSHGTWLFGLAYSIDLVPVDDRGRTAPFTAQSMFRPEAAEQFPGFGRPILAPVDGTVVAVHDGEPDHPTYRGFPSVSYALTQRKRAAGGWQGLAGNHVIIQAAGTGTPSYLALCHMQRGAIRVSVGQQVHTGAELGGCGNSGNSMEPHLHLQAMDTLIPDRSSGLPITFPAGLPRNREIISVGPDSTLDPTPGSTSP